MFKFRINGNLWILAIFCGSTILFLILVGDKNSNSPTYVVLRDLMTASADSADEESPSMKILTTAKKKNLTNRAIRENIFFLKMHKCGSSTIQNILMRFGLQRGLNFALPPLKNYLGHPMPFRPGMLSPEMRPSDGKYNILTHHLRFNAAGVAEVMYEDAAWVTVLRDPASLFESLYSYYSMTKFYAVPLQTLIQSPTSYPAVWAKRLNYRIGVNQMMFDLGLEPDDYNSKEKVELYIKHVDKMFDLVMISDYMEASLVLLADLMNWPLEVVSSLKVNTRPAQRVAKLTAAEKLTLRKINSADTLLYQHFLQKFHQRVEEYGKDRMRTNVNRLLELNEKLQQRCVDVPVASALSQSAVTYYNATNGAGVNCKFATANELSFTKELRDIQTNRIKTLKRLDRLLMSTELSDK